MTISDGRTRLQRIAFSVGGRTFRFALNPESMNHVAPHRTTALKTKSRIIIEDFQADIPTITISGTTGYNPTGRAEDRGVAKIKEMKKFIEDYAGTGGNGKTGKAEFYFHNFTNDESFVVHLAPEGISVSQSADAPLLYKYEIKLIIIRKASEPADADVINPEIGNRFPSLPNGGNYKPSPTYPILPTPMPNRPNTGTPTPTPMPNRPNSNNGSGNVGDDVYNKGNGGGYVPNKDGTVVNPQVPSQMTYQYGMSSLGFNIGYYGRWA